MHAVPATREHRCAFGATLLAALGAAHAHALARDRRSTPAFGAVMSQEDRRDVATDLLEDLLRK